MILSSRKLVSAVIVLGAISCGSVGTSRESARDQATTATCQRFSDCMQIGDGKAYASLDSCQVDWRARWEGYWTPAKCDGKIDPAQLNTCLLRIGSTSCNVADLANTVFVVCPPANVCDAGGAPDGG